MVCAIDFIPPLPSGRQEEGSKIFDSDPIRPESSRGVYGISVAAELVGTGVQNLRLYEARGLLEPERTDGGTRRYSANDLDRLRRISALLDAGLNLAGIAMVLDLEAQNTALRAEKTDRRLDTTPTRAARSRKRPSPLSKHVSADKP
jgi:MerR family transcriptional regulator, heat shock protein HspR